MAAEDKTNANNHGNKNKKRKQRYLPHNRPVKKGSYPLHPGVQGFFLTCDGGRERQATHEAINVIDNFYEELLDGETTGSKLPVLPNKPVNKITKFSDSDSSSGDDADADADDDDKPDSQKEDDANHENLACTKSDIDDVPNHEKQENATSDPQKEDNANKENLASTKSDVHDVPSHEKQAITTMETPAKKQRIETVASKRGNVTCGGTEEKSIDKLIEDEIKELGDRNKRRFVSLDSGCNGVIFVQMHKKDGDPGPAEIVQHMMTSAASTRKHMSRFILRVIPVEVTCYASEEEISKAIKPLVSLHFPAEAQNPQKFAVLYEARANTGVDRMSIINSVAKSVPGPHKVDLNNPDKTIIVQIVKTVCLIGIVEKYKELAKYNLRQLTSPKA